ncbi:carbamoyltransferase HypF [Geoglobus ahangari]|uniref:carbamoyltransferase HypF n=1 Tax=Geoglobus ahangari TaxID=113653 RepID=UPI00069B43B6|nr:carbamoyltransferase HypF [Geoglobus ahangari]
MYRITVTGRVQGVGFRPFIYRLATSMGLRGYVKNVGDGTVEIVVDGSAERFVERMRGEKPPMAVIERVVIEEFGPAEEFSGFSIIESGGKSGLFSLPPPDFAVCERCLKEVFDPANRRHLYPFTTCTDCGQRFSVSFRLPFDRENTTMSAFPLCEDCQREYDDPGDRRYYAQSIACPKCGPRYFLHPHGAEGVEAIRLAARILDEGGIVAVKGIGGYHIACLTDDGVVERLRKLLKRPQQPFAVMVRDLDAAGRYAHIGDLERAELESYVRPIVVLRKKKELHQVAPHLDTVGIMLPYTALHAILFSFLEADALVMTSANLPGEPMAIEWPDVECDAVLHHNLRIHNRVDDSVVKVVNGRRMIIRRSRGFVPTPIPVGVEREAIALGAELYNSVAVLKDGKAIPSQYIGNTSNFRTFSEFFKRAVDFWIEYLDVRPEYVVRDLHPLYNTSSYADELAGRMDARVISVQHHLAHALSVMAERGIDEAVAIAVDGAGFGADGTIWGGEVLHVNANEGVFERVARMERIKLLGGDLSTAYPLRTLFSIIYEHTGSWELLEDYSKYLRENESFELMEMQFRRNLNVAPASSAGRYMDAISAMLEVCFERTYEGEPAMKVESVARRGEQIYEPEIGESFEPSTFSFDGRELGKGHVRVLEFGSVFVDSLERYRAGEDRGVVAWRLIDYLAMCFAEVVRDFDLPVVLSGGVAFNTHFSRSLAERVDYLTNELVPAGDNGISLGQIYALKSLEVLE